MGIHYGDILLRDMIEADIEDWVRWNTIDTEWMDWDGPDLECDPFDEAQFREDCIGQIRNPNKSVRRRFELCTADGTHLGMVSSYPTDDHFEQLPWSRAQNLEIFYHTLGIIICEGCNWNKGIGTQALAAFCKYYLDHGILRLRLQTWSGNVRMVRCAQRIGFVECNRFVGNRDIRGEIYDGLTFQLDLDRFHKYLEENS